MAFDTKGRLWVAAWPNYPHWKPKEPMNDKLLILEDTNGDGKADKCKIFADDLHNPTGFEFWNGGVLVAQAPDLVFLKDTNGDDKADVASRSCSRHRHGRHAPRRQQLHRSTPAARSTSRKARSTTRRSRRRGARRRACANAGVFRYEPRTQKFDVYVSFGFANPHGHVFDRWGQDIVVDGTGGAAVPRRRCSRPRGIPGRSTAGRRRSSDGAPGRAGGIGVSVEPALPRRDAGQLWSCQRDRLPGHPAATRSTRTAPASSDRSRADRSRRPTRTSARRHARSGPTARSTSSTGRTRSSATCSTTCATPAATTATAASIA